LSVHIVRFCSSWLTATYALTLSVHESEAVPVALTIANVRANLDSSGYYGVLGEVTNTGTLTSEYAKISAIFHGSDGKVVGVAFTHTQPDTIQPGETAFQTHVSELAKI
jgi:hypothetical protein